MPQNWWELFPEIQPSGRSFGPSAGRTYRPDPFARRRPLPGPGNMLPGPPMAPSMAAPYAAIGHGPFPADGFDPAYFSGSQPRAGPLPGGFTGSARSVGDPQPLGRSAVVQQAAVAIRGGADPRAVRARLNQVGMNNPDFAPADPFSDLIPGAPRVPGAMSPSDVAQREMLPAEQPAFARDPQKYSREKGGARHSGPAHLFTYGLPSFQSDNQATSNPPREPAGQRSRGVNRSGASGNSRLPPPAPWRPGGVLNQQQVDAYADDGLRMYKIHRALGMTPEQAAGWAANAVAESRGDYRRHQDRHGPGYGLFQWGSDNPRLDRRPIFQRVFGHPIQQSTEQEQLQFRDWELAHNYAWAARHIDRASSAGDIAAAVTHFYEGPADWRHAMWDRANIAEAIMRRVRQMPDVPNPNGGPENIWRQGISAQGSGPVR